MRKIKSKNLFIPYNVGNQYLLPPSWEEIIPRHDPVRVVNEIVEKLDLQDFIAEYSGGGRPSHHPRLMLKLIIYGYINNHFSSRTLEHFARTNINCLWLTNNTKPDHNTINRFRTERLTDALKTVFRQVVLLLVEEGIVSLEENFVDGTKIEANANRYTFVWGKAIMKNLARIGESINELWEYACAKAKEELSQLPPPDLKEITPEKVEAAIKTINEALKDKEIDQKVKQKLNYASKHWPKNIRKYQEQQEILGERNSFSKTDPDATFMVMKEDHMKNGQLKPAYNLQLSTNNQIVTNYTLHQTTNDTTTLPEHIEEFKQMYDLAPEKVIADAGYGSEENYSYLENNNIEPFVKYNTFDKEITSKKTKDFAVETLYYNQEKDCFYCPMGQPMNFQGMRNRKTATGYLQQSRLYRAVNCSGCPLRGVCHKGAGNRTIEINEKVRRYRAEAKQRLLSEEGQKLRIRRNCDVEPVFGNIKQNKGFRRFLLRGCKKVAIETGLVCLAHNIKRVFNLRMIELRPKLAV